MIKSLKFCKLSRKIGENAEEWIGRLWLSAIEYNYKELDRQLKEQFIHGLNDTDILGETIQELTKKHENEKKITSKNVFSWAKRFKVQRAQSLIMNKLTEAKEFDKLKIVKNMHKDNPRRSTQAKTPTKQTCRYCGSSLPLRKCLAYGKRCTECGKIGHFRVVCRSRRDIAMDEVQQVAVQDRAENSIDSVTINSTHFNKICSVLTAKLKMSGR